MTDTTMTLTFALPWPPSVNTYWRHIILGGKHKKARAQTILSEAGKGPLDALRHAGVIVDDENIDDLHIVRGPKRPGGCLVLKVSELGEYREQGALDFPDGASMPIDSMKRVRAGLEPPRLLDRDPF
jgi:hypothetical protein